MNSKRVCSRVLSFLLTLTMLLGLCAPTISALTGDDHDHETKKDKINYVSLGDSMTNGYGLPGYELNSGVESYGAVSYANQFAEWLEENVANEVDHAQLAMSGIRAEDLHWLLELDYNDQEAIDLIQELIDGDWDEEKWNAKFTTGDYWTLEEICNHSRLDATYLAIVGGTNYDKPSMTFPGKLDEDFVYPTTFDRTADMSYEKNRAQKVALVAKYFQEHVAEADIVSLGVGNGNLGVFGFGRILEAVGFGGSAVVGEAIYKIESAIRELDPEMQEMVLELKAELYDVVEETVGMDLESNEMLKQLADVSVYIGVSLVLSYAGSVEAILELNPDAEIMMVAIMNTFVEEKKARSVSVEGVTLGTLMDAIVTPMNAFIAALPTYMQLVDDARYENATFYYAEAPYVECMTAQYGLDFYKDGTPNADSIIRDRFVESIVGNGSGMIWGLLSGTVNYNPTYEDVLYYDGLSDAGKLAFALKEMEEGESGPSYVERAMALAIYFAFEKAIIDCKDEVPGLDKILGLGTIVSSFDFGAIMDAYYEAAAEQVPTKLDAVCAFMAQTAKALLENEINPAVRAYLKSNGMSEQEADAISVSVDVTADQIKAIVLAETPDAKTAAANVIADNAIAAVVTTIAPIYVGMVANTGVSYIGEVLNGFNAQIKTQTGIDVGLNATEYYAHLLDIDLVEKIDNVAFAKAFYNDSTKNYEGLADYITEKTGGLVNAPALIAVVKDSSLQPIATGIAPIATDEATANAVKSLLDSMVDGGDAQAYISGMLSANITSENVTLLATLLVTPDTLGAVVAESELKGLLGLFSRCIIGNGLGAHPSAAGHNALADALISAYKNEYTAEKETIKNLLVLRDLLLEYYDEAYAYAYDKAEEEGLIAELNAYLDLADKYIDDAEAWLNSYSEFARSEAFVAEIEAAIADAHNTVDAVRALINNADELDAESYEYVLDLLSALATNAGDIADLFVIAIVDAGEYADPYIAAFMAEVEQQIAIAKAAAEAKIAELKAEAEAKIAELNAKLEAAVDEAKAAIEAEIARIEAELNAAIAAIKADVEAKIAEMRADAEIALADLRAQLNAQYEAAVAELNAIVESMTQDMVEIVAAAAETVKEIVVFAKDYLKTNLPEEYNKLVELILAQLPVVDQYLYNWFYNNPDVVIEFFAEYGDDMAAFLVENADVIIAILAYIGVNYGDEILEYVIENADEILRAFVSWYNVYGERTWDLIKVYLDALFADVDLSNPEELLAALDSLFALIVDFGSEFIDAAWDKLVEYGIVDDALAALEKIKNDAWDQIVYLEGEVSAQIQAQIDRLNAELAELNAKLETAVGEAKAAIEAEIARVKAELAAAIAAAKAQAEAQIAALKAQAEAQIAALKAAAEAKLAELNAKLETAVGEAKAAIEAEIARVKAELVAAIEAVNAQVEAQIAALKAQAEAQIAALKAAAEAKIAELRAQLEAVTEEIKAAIEAQIAQVEAVIAQLKAELAKIDAAIAEIIAVIEDIIAEIQRIQGTVKEIVEQIKNNVNSDKLLPLLKDALADLADALVGVVDATELLEKLEASLNALVKEGVVELEGALINLSEVIKPQLILLVNKMNAAVDAFVKDALTGEYLVKEESYYLAIGNNPAFAELLAEQLKLDLDRQFAVNGWDDISIDAIRLADLITISYSESYLNGFAMSQGLGYAADYLNNDLKPTVNAFVVKAITEFASESNLISDEAVNALISQFEAILNDTVDSVSDEYFGDATVEEMDWAAVVGAENVGFVDSVRAELRKEIIEQGIPEVYTIEIPVLDLFYSFYEENPGAFGEEVDLIFKYTNKEAIYEMFGENATFVIEIPVVDTLVFAGESYVYGYAQFTKNYADTMATINAINPDATVVVLGHYNAFNGLDAFGTDLGEIYGYLAKVVSAQAFAYALVYDNVVYVDIADAETVFAANGIDSIEEFVLAYLEDSSITDVSEAGHQYICDQILNALTVTCSHVWIDATCTAPKTCERCGATEGELAPHIPNEDDDDCTTAITCSVCGEVTTPANADHIPNDDDGDCTTAITCSVCGKVTTEAKAAHTDANSDGKCDVCGKDLGTTPNPQPGNKVDKLENSEHGISIKVPAGSTAVLPEGAELHVEKLDPTSLAQKTIDAFTEKYGKDMAVLGYFDISIYLDGATIQPNGKLLVTLPTPSEKYDNYKVVYIADDGSIEECVTRVNADGTIEFETDHFSKYALIGFNSAAADNGANVGDVSDDSKGLPVGAIIAIIVVALAAIAAIVLFFLEKKKKAAKAVETETSAEEAPAEETTAEEATAEEVPAEEVPVEEVPAEEATAEEVPAEEVPAEEALVEEVLAEEVPAEEVPAEETFAEVAVAEEVLAEEIPATELTVSATAEIIAKAVANATAEVIGSFMAEVVAKATEDAIADVAETVSVETIPAASEIAQATASDIGNAMIEIVAKATESAIIRVVAENAPADEIPSEDIAKAVALATTEVIGGAMAGIVANAAEEAIAKVAAENAPVEEIANAIAVATAEGIGNVLSEVVANATEEAIVRVAAEIVEIVSAEEVLAEEVPAEEVLAEEVPVEEVPAEEVPAEEVSTEETEG